MRFKSGSRTGTRTQTKARMKMSRARRLAPNSSISAFRFGRRISRFMVGQFRRMRGRQTVYRNGTTFKSSGVGRQTFLQQEFLGKTELDAIKTKYGSATLTFNEVKFFLGYARIQYFIKNQSSCAGRVTIYDIVPRLHPVTTALDTPVEAWEKGVREMTATQPAGLHLTVGQTPFKSPEFVRHYAVLRTTTVQMEPGEQHQHNVYRRINRIVSSTQWDNTSITNVPGITTYVMLVWHGSLGHDKTADSDVTFLPMKLDVAWTMEFNYAVPDNNSPSYDFVDAFDNITPEADLEHMGEDQDTILPITAA